MRVYLETSAALRWLLKEPSGRLVADCLTRSRSVLTSRLTLVECHRGLSRLGHEGAGDMTVVRATLEAEARQWTLLEFGSGVLARAGQPFPAEPVRALDALHLASALTARDWVPDLELVSFDQRVRANALRLGFSVIPA